MVLTRVILAAFTLFFFSVFAQVHTRGIVKLNQSEASCEVKARSCCDTSGKSKAPSGGKCAVCFVVAYVSHDTPPSFELALFDRLGILPAETVKHVRHPMFESMFDSTGPPVSVHA